MFLFLRQFIGQSILKVSTCCCVYTHSLHWSSAWKNCLSRRRN